MKNEPEFQMPYKAPLAQIPQSALRYAELDQRYKDAKRKFKRMVRDYGINSDKVEPARRECLAIEREMEAHASKGTANE